MKNTMYFIGGVSGVGKTSVKRLLPELLPAHFEIHDFDERGVPDNASRQWRLDETRRWLELGEKLAANGTILVVCGFANPEEILNLKTGLRIDAKVILLHADPEIVEARLRGRNTDSEVLADFERAVGSAEEFIRNNIDFVPKLREICERCGCKIVDTSALDAKNAAVRVADLVKETQNYE